MMKPPPFNYMIYWFTHFNFFYFGSRYLQNVDQAHAFLGIVLIIGVVVSITLSSHLGRVSLEADIFWGERYLSSLIGFCIMCTANSGYINPEDSILVMVDITTVIFMIIWVLFNWNFAHVILTAVNKKKEKTDSIFTKG